MNQFALIHLDFLMKFLEISGMMFKCFRNCCSNTPEYASFAKLVLFLGLAKRIKQVFRASQKRAFCLAERITRVALNEQAIKLYFFLLWATFKMHQDSYFLRTFFVMHPSKMRLFTKKQFPLFLSA